MTRPWPPTKGFAAPRASWLALTPKLRIAALALTVSWMGCGESESHGGDAGTDVPVESFDFEIGADDGTGALAPVSVDDTLEIVVGFQGLISVDLLLAIPSDIGRVFSAECEVHFLAEPKYDFGFRVNRVEFDAGDTPGQLVGDLRVPFGQDVALIHRHRITVDVVLRAAGWEAENSASFRIADDEQCIENPAGELECE